LDAQNYVDLIEAYECDLIFQSAQRNGVYLKTVISDKNDPALDYIDYDGHTALPLAAKISTQPSCREVRTKHPSRWLQKPGGATCRQVGAYTSLHSWELSNEGDPSCGSHYTWPIRSLTTFIDQSQYLCCTSFWAFRTDGFWKSMSCTMLMGIGYAGTKSAERTHRLCWIGLPDFRGLLAGIVLPFDPSAGDCGL